MRLQLLSDTHLEFHQDEGQAFIESLDPAGVDVLILAGDICLHRQISKSLNLFASKYPRVIYVPGNHEFYDSSLQEVYAFLSNLNIPNLSILDNSSIELEGHRFLGSTLWFPNDVDNFLYKQNMADFHYINNFSTSVYDKSQESRDYFNNNISKGDIIITHHLPSYQSVHPKFKNSQLNRFFVYPLDDIILEEKPALWFHGHTHSSLDYQLGETRVVCNPFGYAGHELNPDFVEKLVIDT